MSAMPKPLPQPALNRLLLIDDHPLFLEGLELVLAKAWPGVQVDCAGSMEQALARLDHPGVEYDLVTLDWSLPDAKGGALLRAIQQRRLYVPVLVVSATASALDLTLAMNAGASGFVGKSLGRQALIEAIDRVLAGEIVVLAEGLQSEARHLVEAPTLTPRQREVLELLGRGWSNKQICQALNLTEHTVKTHLKVLFQALDAHNRTECVRRAQDLGLLNR